jgi:hypothetical protein
MEVARVLRPPNENMKIANSMKDDAEYTPINAVTEDVGHKVTVLASAGIRFCVSEMNLEDAESLATQMEAQGYSSTAVAVQTEAERVVGSRIDWTAYVSLWLEPSGKEKL